MQQHEHIYHIATGPVTLRYCPECGMSWVLDGSYGWHWNKVREPETPLLDEEEQYLRDYNMAMSPENTNLSREEDFPGYAEDPNPAYDEDPFLPVEEQGESRLIFWTNWRLGRWH